MTTEEVEKAVFGKGFDNGLVVFVRRVIATGLSREANPRIQK
jgi:hypothetical protein